MSFDITLTNPTVIARLKQCPGHKRQTVINEAAGQTDLNPRAFGIVRFNSMKNTAEITVRSEHPISPKIAKRISENFEMQLGMQLHPTIQVPLGAWRR